MALPGIGCGFVNEVVECRSGAVWSEFQDYFPFTLNSPYNDGLVSLVPPAFAVVLPAYQESAQGTNSIATTAGTASL